MYKGFSRLGFLSLIFMLACNFRGELIEGNGIVVEEERALEAFSSIEIEGDYVVELEQGAAGISIQADSNLMPYIQSEVKRNTLVLKSTKNIKGSDGITIRVRFPELEELKVGGAGRVSNAGTLQANKLDIEVTGAAVLDLEVEVQRKISLEISGASEVSFRGSAQQLDASLSGAGNLNAYELRVRDASVDLSGVGGAQVYATDNLQGKVSGVGGIQYKGEPRNIQRQVSGVGSIEAAGAND